MCIIFIRKKKETRARDLAYYCTLSLPRKVRSFSLRGGGA